MQMEEGCLRSWEEQMTLLLSVLGTPGRATVKHRQLQTSYVISAVLEEIYRWALLHLTSTMHEEQVYIMGSEKSKLGLSAASESGSVGESRLQARCDMG